MGAAFPEASTNPEQNALGTIKGSNYGGHAPLAYSHVYVLQPSVSTGNGTSTNPQYNAYAAQATSLLTSHSSGSSYGGYATTQNSSGADPGIPTSWYYVTTDATGAFNISGDYTCTVGLPVYLYIYGGTPSYPSTTNTVSVSSVNVTASNYTFTTSNQNAYVGESVQLYGLGAANNLYFLNYNNPGPIYNYQPTIIAGSGGAAPSGTSLSNTQFSVVNPYGGTPGTYPQTGATAVFLPTPNPAIVNLAVLGNCPNGTSTPFSSLSYVYVNEVSTVAAAYAFAPFTSPANNNATYIGTSSTNITGIQNAALTANLLYDIQGSNLSTTYAGEGHTARFQTPNGNGTVPQATIDTIANILAACVDSNNTSTTIGNSGISTPCSTLFTNATNTGIPSTAGTSPGTPPVDTAQAAINIARHPGGPPYSYSSSGSTNFVNALYTLPTGTNSPFAPTLPSQPNDFTIAISYTGTQIANPESIAMDKLGNVWATSQASGGARYFYELSPTGVLSNANTQSSYIYGYVAVDTNGDAWVGDAQAVGPQSYIHVTNPTVTATSGAAPVSYTYSSSTASTTYPTGPSGSSSAINDTYTAFADSSGNMYFTFLNGANDYIEKYTGSSTSPTGTATAALPAFNNTVPVQHGKIDAAGYAYLVEQTANISRNNISTGANYTSGTWPLTATQCANMTGPQDIAVTRSGDAIAADYGSSANSTSVYYITAAGVCTQLPNSTLNAGITGGPFGVAVDGNDYVYITNRGNPSGTTISVLNTQAGTAAGTVAVSPAGGYQPTNSLSPYSSNINILNGPLNIAIDPSGNVWTTNYAGSEVVEMIGLAAPTTEPLAAAAIPISYTQGSIGYKP